MDHITSGTNIASQQLQKSMRRVRIPYDDAPDYTRPLLEIPAELHQQMFERFCFLYGEEQAQQFMPELERILKVHYAHKPPELIEAEKDFDPNNRFTEWDLILITYGDLLKGEGQSPLSTLAHFLNHYLGLSINTLHILPFFPYSSDRGFSVIDFDSVDPNLGSWKDIEEMGNYYQLMFDGVFNHVSSKSPLFQRMLNGNPDYKDYFTTYQSPDELTPEERRMIVRPRTSDILTQFQSINGPIWVWTTFSPDQIDLNYKNPKVLLGVIETLLLYIRRGANLVRLDAVTYLWEEPGTPCANLEQTHQVIKLFRDIVKAVAPNVGLITETNVPHEQNVSYFGNGYDEAQMVYNFALPPLVLYTFYREDTTALSNWAKELKYLSPMTTFLNMLDTHDGVGLMGVKSILPKEEVDFIIQNAREHGAFVSYKTGEQGEEPYEINTTWFSALNLDNSGEEISFQVKRFIASRSIALVLRGVPGIYFHGLIGTRNDIDAVLRTKSKRDINRRVIDVNRLIEDLQDRKSKLSLILQKLGHLLDIRVRYTAFHPNGEQKILIIAPEIFAVLRTSPEPDQSILTLTNVANKICQVEIPLSELEVAETNWYDLVGQRGWTTREDKLVITLQPYDVKWLIPFVQLERSIES
ncbi:MAG: alpha-amylase family glycosyl hydrolase [Lyngbya sp.]|nr:alpha-amylase family glycosyl hydrolase [Lyngbya sp.]